MLLSGLVFGFPEEIPVGEKQKRQVVCGTRDKLRMLYENEGFVCVDEEVPYGI
jgi:hypothetical protein